jgi:hypothetical protein
MFGVAAGSVEAFDFNSSDNLRFYTIGGSGALLASTAVFRDTSAWMHLVLSVDTTQATASNRTKIYVNGAQITQFGSSTYPAQNYDTFINNNNIHYIGDRGAGSQPFDGYLADIHFIDGQALDPTSFGEFSATTGVWMPKAYTGTYGTNGFHLDFSNNASAAALGTDSSGQGNTWSVNNLSVTAGAGNDSLVDVPSSTGTDTGVGGEVRGNYCTLNPLTSTSGTYSQGNLRFVGPSAYRRSNGSIAVSTGKWYWEVTLGNGPVTPRISTSQWNAFGFGLSTVFGSTTNMNAVTDALVLQDNGYYKNFSGSNTDGGTAFSSGDVLSIAVDLDANTFTFRQNNTQIVTGTIGGTAGRELVPVIISYDGQYGVMDCNFGQRPFAYTAPSGFKALCTANLPAPVVTKPSTVMDVKLYTGNGTSQTISGLGFSPDLVWTKSRSAFDRHNVFDILRSGLRLRTDGTEAEDSTTVALTSNGFSLGSQSENNSNGQSYVAWTWDAGSSTVTNTQGSITSSVRTNNYLSIVTYTGTGANATVGHGLGVAPQMIIVKSRGSVTNWGVGHTSIGWANALRLNTTDASSAQATFWNSTAPTSTVFSVGTGPSTNNNGDSIVAYCFAPVAGYASMGSFVANANSDGPFVYTSFKPRLVLCKLSSASGADWLIFDTARSPYNVVQANLRPNTSGAEESAFARIDILSNGFKVRAGSGVEPNGTNGNTYIYAAWAESPFNYSRAA